MLKAEEPAPAKKYERFYEKAFDPAKFFGDMKEEVKRVDQEKAS